MIDARYHTFTTNEEQLHCKDFYIFGATYCPLFYLDARSSTSHRFLDMYYQGIRPGQRPPRYP